MDKIRVMRVLVYEGPRDMVEVTARGSCIPWEGQKTVGEVTIKSAIVDKIPEILEVINDETAEIKSQCHRDKQGTK